MIGSIPSFTDFDPYIIAYQAEVIKDIRQKFDYGLGVHEILLSGSVGSAKSILLAHIAVSHCLLYPNALFGIGRRTMPHLRGTLLELILKHIDGCIDYDYNKTTGVITFIVNGSRIMPFSWADGKVKNVRSYEFTSFAVEELTENEDSDFFTEIRMRLGRRNDCPEKIFIAATNPDEPDHWAYDRFIQNKNKTTHVYYSNTSDNPFLPLDYIESLKENLDSKLAQRMLEGKWLSIRGDTIYYAYEKDNNFKDVSYRVNPNYPIYISFDFNIGLGKPLSACLFQYIGREFHFFNEVVIEGARTEDACEEIAAKGLLDYATDYIITGDSTGRHRDTRNKRSDWDIIDKFFDNYTNRFGSISYSMEVPISNPKVRERHNKVNAVCCNSKGIRNLFVYKDAPTVDEGLRLTKLKKGAQYLEDDTPSYQHISTAVGYGICTAQRITDKKVIRMLAR